MTQNASRLYNELIKFGSQYSAWSDVRHLGVMAWMMVGMIATGSVNLTKWLSHINTKALIAQSTQRQLSRWLNNPRINPAKLYSPVIKALIATWKEPEIYLSFDTSQLWEEYCIIRLCVVHQGRALPLCWRVIKHRSSSVEMSTYQDMLKRASIAAAWESGSREYWYILSTEPTTIQTFWEYGLRFDIEENFLDDKSNGFDLESSRLRSAPAISRLCLVIAMTTLFLTAQGLAVADSGYRRFI